MNKKETGTPQHKKVKIATGLKMEARCLLQQEAQVTMRCSLKVSKNSNAIRISKETYLIPHGFNYSCPCLKYAERITTEWTTLKAGRTYHFTLIFFGLPRGCETFDLQEMIKSPSAFVVRNIKRNKTDVYDIILDV